MPNGSRPRPFRRAPTARSGAPHATPTSRSTRIRTSRPRPSVPPATPARSTRGAQRARWRGGLRRLSRVNRIVPHDEPRSAVHWSSLASACAHCHADGEPADASAPARTAGRGVPRERARAARSPPGQRGAVCSDCHGAHDILPARDPRSSIWRSTCPRPAARAIADDARSVPRERSRRGAGARRDATRPCAPTATASTASSARREPGRRCSPPTSRARPAAAATRRSG